MGGRPLGTQRTVDAKVQQPLENRKNSFHKSAGNSWGRKVEKSNSVSKKTNASESLSPNNKERKISVLNENSQNSENDYLCKDLHKYIETANNRLDKKVSKLGYTYLAYKGAGRKESTARMLNTVPKAILYAKGVSINHINSFPNRKRTNSLSDKALPEKALLDIGLSPGSRKWIERGMGKFLGKGSFGTVKFAEIYDEEKGRAVVVAAKKIKANKSNIQNIEKELLLQDKAGSAAVKYYGLSKTKDKYGKDEYVVFMEIAQGVEGQTFFDQVARGQRPLSPDDRNKIAINLINTVRKMHENGVYHRDLKWENVYIDPSKDFEVKILDFGLGTDELNPQMQRRSSPTYVAPESLGEKLPTQVNAKKLDVYSAGVMLLEIYSANEKFYNPFTHVRKGVVDRWTEDTKGDEKNIIDKKMGGILLHKIGRRLIPAMMNLDPNKRPRLERVSRFIERYRL